MLSCCRNEIFVNNSLVENPAEGRGSEAERAQGVAGQTGRELIQHVYTNSVSSSPDVFKKRA